MLKKNWCLIVLLLLVVSFFVFAYMQYKHYHYSPIEGHTETAQEIHSSDDYDHCFKQENANDVVLVANMPVIKPEDVTLVNLNAMGTINPKSSKVVVGTTVDDHPKITDLGDGKIEIRFTDKRFHLGPGPYMVVAAMPAATAQEKSMGEYRRLFYYYQTYDKQNGNGPNQCAAYRPDPNLNR
jgi:hypothetical protein